MQRFQRAGMPLGRISQSDLSVILVLLTLVVFGIGVVANPIILTAAQDDDEFVEEEFDEEEQDEF